MDEQHSNKGEFTLSQAQEAEVMEKVEALKAVCQKYHLPFIAVIVESHTHTEKSCDWSIMGAQGLPDDRTPFGFYKVALAVAEPEDVCIKSACPAHKWAKNLVPGEVELEGESLAIPLGPFDPSDPNTPAKVAQMLAEFLTTRQAAGGNVQPFPYPLGPAKNDRPL